MASLHVFTHVHNTFWSCSALLTLSHLARSRWSSFPSQLALVSFSFAVVVWEGAGCIVKEGQGRSLPGGNWRKCGSLACLATFLTQSKPRELSDWSDSLAELSPSHVCQAGKRYQPTPILLSCVCVCVPVRFTSIFQRSPGTSPGYSTK